MFSIKNLPERNPYLGPIREHLPDLMWSALTDEEKWYNVFYEAYISNPYMRIIFL